MPSSAEAAERAGFPVVDLHTASSLGEARMVAMNDSAGLPPELMAALEPVLRDLAVIPVQPRVDPGGSSSLPEQVTAMTWWPDGSGAGVYILTTDTTAQRVAMLADQIQEATVESLPSMGRPAVWPECPDHPNGHPLQAVVLDSTAVWTCPRTGRQISEIGSLRATQ